MSYAAVGIEGASHHMVVCINSKPFLLIEFLTIVVPLLSLSRRDEEILLFFFKNLLGFRRPNLITGLSR